MIDLSICILNWNTKDLTIKCIESIKYNTKKINYEIILVDNGSNDGLYDFVKYKYPEIILLRNSENLGFSKGNNQALKIFRGRYALLLNSDTEIKDKCLDLMVEYLDNDKDVGIGFCKMYYPDGSLYLNMHNEFPNWRNVLAERSIITELFFKSKLHNFFYRKYYVIDSKKYEEDNDSCAWGLGAFLMIRRKLLEKIGFIDENFFSFFEEIDYCKRCIEAGWKVKYYHRPVVIHHTAKSLVQEYPKMTQVWHHSRFYFFSKHYGIFSMLFLKFITASGILVRFYKIKKQLEKCSSSEERKKLQDLFESYKKIFKMSILFPKYKINYY